MRKLIVLISAMALLTAFTTLAEVATAFTVTSATCPWQIQEVGVGKWPNGNQKEGTWYKGSFPISSGVSEQPDWSINGTSAGKSQTQDGARFLPNTSYRLVMGSNTFKVQFNKPPYNGAFFKCAISGFNWDDVPKGGYKWYSCR